MTIGAGKEETESLEVQVDFGGDTRRADPRNRERFIVCNPGGETIGDDHIVFPSV